MNNTRTQSFSNKWFMNNKFRSYSRAYVITFTEKWTSAHPQSLMTRSRTPLFILNQDDITCLPANLFIQTGDFGAFQIENMLNRISKWSRPALHFSANMNIMSIRIYKNLYWHIARCDLHLWISKNHLHQLLNCNDKLHGDDELRQF